MTSVDRTLLVVSQRPLDLGGGGSARWQHLRRALPRHGWTVVECSSPTGATGNEMSTDSRAAALAERRARVMQAVRVALEPPSWLLRVQPEALAPNNLWALTGRNVVRGAIEHHRPDVVLATAPPPSAMFAAAGAGISEPLVIELRDLWAGNPYFDRGGPVLRALQRRVLERAAAVVTVTEGCRETLIRLHPELARQIELLPNGFDPSLLTRRSTHERMSIGPAKLIHAGVLYGDRTAESLLTALARPELRGRVRLELVGAIDARTRRATASASGVEVLVEPPVSWEEATQRMAAADIVVVINAPGTGGDVAVPSKLYEALALGQPVLVLGRQGGDSARLLDKLGQGAGLAPPDDPAAIASAIDRLLTSPPPPVRPDAMQEFSRDRIAARYAALLDEVATSSSSETSSGTTASRR
jgi:glycosyltransferase involved in cell wall biosynthesis